jgi:hypothetical protein
MIINLEEVNDDVSDLAALSRKLIARKVWVNWPHLTYAFVTGVLTRQAKFYQDVTGRVVRGDLNEYEIVTKHSSLESNYCFAYFR